MSFRRGKAQFARNSGLGLRMTMLYAMDIEDAEARVRAITGCTLAEARAHVKAAHELGLEGLTDDPLGFAVRTLASGGQLLGQGEGSA